MRYTGQRSEAGIGLYFYGARWYDAALGRFIQADTIVPNPGNPISWDHFAYVANNPIINVDPTGHKEQNFEEAGEEDDSSNDTSSDDENPLDDIVGEPSGSDDQPLCGPNTPGCDPYSDRVWSYEEIQYIINLLEQYRDYATSISILSGLVTGISGLLGQVPVSFISFSIAAESAWEAYNADTLIEYFNGASDIAKANEGVRISFYKHKDAYDGIFTTIYYEGAYSEFVVTSPVLDSTLNKR
jgi:RHS repeat-associated protein